MLNLDKKTLHAIEAMLTIANYQGEELMSGKEIASKHDLPPRYLEQMLQKLVRADLLRGVRGPRGGYVLAREKRKIMLADIIDAIEEEASKATFESQHPKLTQLLDKIELTANEIYQTTSLQSLMVPKAAPKVANFAI